MSFLINISSMEVGSPETGFDEMSDLLKDDESTPPEDLDLSFITSKDIAGDFAYKDSAGNQKFTFHLSEQGQSELPSLSSDLGCYAIPGPCTENFHSSAQSGCHSDGLLRANADDDQKLYFGPLRNKYYGDTNKLCGDYLGDSISQMDAESVDHEVLKDVCTHPQGFVSLQDHDLEGEIIDRPNTPPDIEIGEETFLEALERELNQAEFTYNEEEEHEVSVGLIHKLHSPSLHWGYPDTKSENVNDSGNSPDASKEVDSARVDQHDQGRTSQFSVCPVTHREISVSAETSLCAHLLTDDHRVSASNGLNDISYSNTSPDQIYSQAECCDQNGNTPSIDHSLDAARQTSVSSQGSEQRSQHMESSPAKGVATPRNRHRKRSRSQSPSQRSPSSRCRRDSSTNSQSRSPYTRESHKRSSEKAAWSHLSPRSQNVSVSQGSKELLQSSRSCKHKHGLVGSSYWCREATCKDHLLDSCCQKSSIPHESRERFVNSSSSKHVPASPRNHHSHNNHRKGCRTVSPSPVRQRNLCSCYKSDCKETRSRSPYGRNSQSPRKRYSPRHQSRRSYFSRHRSPEIRYLSPSSCRRAGIGKPGTCLFVAGFGFLTTERELERKFSRFGRVRNVRIIRDKRSGISRGYGFLSLERDEEADAAIRALHRTEWNGRVVLVEKSISN